MTVDNLFTYGTLMLPEIVSTILGKPVEKGIPAVLHHYQRYPVIGENFPGITDKEDALTEGVLYTEIPTKLLCRLDAYEGDLYQRKRVEVICNGLVKQAWCYLIRKEHLSELDYSKEWCIDQFVEQHLMDYLD